MKIGSMLAAHARRRRDGTAVVCGEDALSFAALDARSDRIANALAARGLEPGDRVVVYGGNSLALVEAFAGIWKAGAVAVPVSTWIVGPELRFMVGDCAPQALIFGPDQAGAVAAAVADAALLRVFTGDAPPAGAVRLAELAEEGPAGAPPPLDAAPDDAVIGYTSGTTGTPKGAVITHANLILQCLLTASMWGTAGGDVYLVTTPLAHRTGLARLISCFCLGAKVVVLPRFDADAAIAAIARHRVTVIGGVPTTARMIVDRLEPNDPRCASLRYLLATGEAFPVPLKRRLAQCMPQVKLYSFYAMTEGSAPAALGPEDQDTHPDSVGKPMPGVEVRLIDAAGNDVPTGGEGEILVRSGQPGRLLIMREYFNRPDATREAFVGDWFRTGDVGRFDSDGFLYIVDRVKDMILSGGLNIYSREVEQALESHPAVAEVAVVASPDPEFGECVVAFVVPRDDADATTEDLVAHCRARIAGYKKPKHMIFLNRLPRNANGKVEKPALRERAAREIGTIGPAVRRGT